MFEIAKRIAVEQGKNGNLFCITHSSLSIASFRGIRRGIILFNSSSYSLQKSSAIQQISVTLLISFIEDRFIVIYLVINNKHTKNNPLFGLL